MTTPATGRFRSSVLEDWIKPQFSSFASLTDVQLEFARMPDMPDRIVNLTIGGGPGLMMEGRFDTVNVQARCRGGQNNYSDAEDIAIAIDDIFLGAEFPKLLTDVFVTTAYRSGEAPTVLERTDTQERTSFVCNYFFTVSTGVGK